jgi:hypothetical protein
MLLQNHSFHFRRSSFPNIFKSIDGAVAVKCLSDIVLPSELQNLEPAFNPDVHIGISQQLAAFHTSECFDLI